MIDLPNECTNTLEHASAHLKSALEAEAAADKEQVLHDLYLLKAITTNCIERLETKRS